MAALAKAVEEAAIALVPSVPRLAFCHDLVESARIMIHAPYVHMCEQSDLRAASAVSVDRKRDPSLSWASAPVWQACSCGYVIM